MKKRLIALLGALMVFSLTGCGGAPSDDEIKAALEDGTITMEDAKEKGWIDDEWIAENVESVQAVTKVHGIDSFDTTYLDGTPASSQLIAGEMCLVFFNTEEEQTQEKLEVFRETAAELEEMGISTLGIITDENPDAAKEGLSDMPFPIIVYNEEMQTSLASYGEMIDKDLVFVFTKNGGFYTAWNTNADAEVLLSCAGSLVDEA